LKKKTEPNIYKFTDRLPLERFIPFAFLSFLLLFIVLTIFIYKSINSYRESITWVNDTNEVLKTIDELNLVLSQMHLYRRDYIVKNNKEFLLEFDDKKEILNEKLEKLRVLTKNNPKQVDFVQLMDSLANRSVKMLDSSIAVFNVSKTIETGIQSNLASASQDYMNKFFSAAEKLKDEERKLLNIRNDNADISLLNTQIFIISTSLLVFIVLGLSMYVSTRLIKKKNTAEKLLKQSSIELEDKVEARTAELKSSNENLISEIKNRIVIEQTLRESEKRFKVMADSAPVMIWMSGPDKLLSYFNKVWLEFTGRTMEQELGTGWRDGVHPDDLKRYLNIYNKTFDKRGVFEIEYRLKTASGDYRWVNDRGVPRYAEGEFTGYVGSCIDIHSKKSAESYLKIQYSVSKSLTESTSVREALNKVLRSICTELSWGLGIIWTVKNEKLVSEASWSGNPDYYTVMNYDNFTFEKGAGLPGRVWKFNKSIWIQKIENDSNLPQKEEILKSGMKSAFGFPVTEGNNVTAVIECFSKYETAPDEELLQVLETAGRQIGNFLERKKVEEKLKISNDELENNVKERTVELANTLNRLLAEIKEKEKAQNRLKLFAHAIKGVKECIFITDLNINTIFVNSAFEFIFGYLEQELLFKKIPVLFSPSIDETGREIILKESMGGGWRGELKSRRKNGSEFFIYLSTTVIRNDEGKVEALVGICQDISESKQQKELLEKRFNLLKILNEVIVSVNKSFNLEYSISYAINKLCEYTSWDVGHCYFAENNKIVTSRLWNANLSSRYLSLKEVTEQTIFLKNEGLPGRAFIEKKSYWVHMKDLTGSPYSKRAEQVYSSGLKTGIWVPIIKNNTVMGVLEFFNRKDIPPDNELLDCITNVCIEIGSLYERNEFLELLKEREEHFKAISENANEAIITLNTEGKIIYNNKSAEEIFGYFPGELTGKEITVLIPEDLIDKHKESFNRVVKTGESVLIGKSIEMRGKRANGKEFPIELSLARWELNNQTYFTGIIRDVSIRKQTESELLESRNSLLEAQTIAGMGNWEWDVNSNTVKWSDEMYNIYELSPDEFDHSYEGFLSRIHHEDLENVKSQIETACKTRSSFEFYEKIVTPSGKEKILWSQGNTRIDMHGNIVKLVGTCLDVTEVHEAEEKIKESEEQLRLIMDNIKDYSIVVLDEKGFIKNWNKAAMQINGYERNEIVDKHFSIFYPPREIAENEPDLNLENARNLGHYEREGWRVRKDGSLFWADIIYSALRDDEGNLKGFVKVTRDMTERKKAQEALKESEQRLREAQKIAKTGSWEWDVKSNKVVWSDEMYRILEIDKDFDIKKLENIKSLIYQEDFAMAEKIIAEFEKKPADMKINIRIVTKDARLKYLSNDIRVEYDNVSNPVRIFGSTQDITDIKIIEEELRHANIKLMQAQNELIHKEKLAALGRFSSGIAHEIRNPLANISALAQLLSKADINDEKMKKHLKYILINTEIANTIIKQLLQFASHEDLSLSRENISEVLDNIINSIEQRCVENKVVVSREINLDSTGIYLDKIKFETALLNFLSNSVDAMPKGGTLTIKANIEDESLIIDVIDTGCGIEPDNLDKIFEPFFTTKENGTGLGLALAYQSIKLHDGILNIKSKPGKGTHIEIELPIGGKN
jgi:PAS domain S-box-containing protein